MNSLHVLIVKIALTVASAVLVVTGLIALGHYLRDDLGTTERYQFSIEEIECDPPAGQTREDFLAEVQYYGQLPDKLNALDCHIGDKVKSAFLKHPKVEDVDKVLIVAPNHVRVEAIYRKADNHEADEFDE